MERNRSRLQLGRSVFYIDFDGSTGSTLVGTLDVANGQFREIDIPFNARTGNDLQIRPSDGALFTCDLETAAIALVDVHQRTLRTWTVSDSDAGGPRSIAFDDAGRVLFLASTFIGPTVIGRLDTATGLMETWQVPDEVVTVGEDLAGRIVNAADGSIFFSAGGFAHPGQLVRLDPATGVFTAWATPAQPILGLAADGAGAIYFQEVGSLVAHLAPATNVLTEWSFSPDGQFTQKMILESAKLFFGTDFPVGLGELDPTIAGSASTLAPVTADPVAPASVLVKAVVTRHSGKRHGHARDVTRRPSATAIGPFTSWATDVPSWVAGDGAGMVYFTDGENAASNSRFVP